MTRIQNRTALYVLDVAGGRHPEGHVKIIFLMLVTAIFVLSCMASREARHAFVYSYILLFLLSFAWSAVRPAMFLFNHIECDE